MRDWLAHRVRSTPSALAAIDGTNGDRWEFDDLDSAVERTTRRLAGLGLTAGDHCGILMDTRFAFVRLIHATMRLGVRIVPLNARLTETELTEQADRVDLDALIVGGAFADTAAAITDADTPIVTVDADAGIGHLEEIEAADYTPAEWSIEEPQAMLFTSGTTGEPKAVVLTMGNLLASAGGSAFRLGVHTDDRWLVPLSMYHMGGLAPVLRSTLYGTTVVFQREFDPAAVVAAIEEYRITGMSLVPTMLDAILDVETDLSDSLRFVLLGGAPASTDLIERCARHGIPVYPTWGMTETASQIATATPQDAFEYAGTVGTPLMFTDVTVIDEDGTPVETGEIGELVVDGPTVTPGYYDAPERTAEAFCTYGLRTGDIGYRDQGGRLWVLNRKDDRIITGGENVYPGEVVDVLRDHPAVEDAAVVGLEDPKWGERVAALIVPADADEPPDREALLAFCRDRLAGYKLPKTLTTAAELPRTASGTVDRSRVRDRLEAVLEE
ncbi:MAG: o-succinylbenzoate--CoA ligase [Halobacteriales archaeon]|nr:o-succinylbenzoate--CoA ligase [Halobacteriales archaeon]